jgi:hypothetical protein
MMLVYCTIREKNRHNFSSDHVSHLVFPNPVVSVIFIDILVTRPRHPSVAHNYIYLSSDHVNLFYLSPYLSLLAEHLKAKHPKSR